MHRFLCSVLAVVVVLGGCAAGSPGVTPTGHAGSPSAAPSGPVVPSSGGVVQAGGGPGISVSEALASKLDGPLLVNGALVVDGTGARLCTVLRESFPPQCGSPSLVVKGLDTAAIRFQQASGVRWVEATQLLGHVRDGELTISTTAR